MTETLPLASEVTETMQPLNPELYVQSDSVRRMLAFEHGKSEAPVEPADLPPSPTSAKDSKDLVEFKFDSNQFQYMLNCSL